MAIRLILVDDHALVRDALAQVLAAVPDLDVVGTAGDGAAGLKLAREVEPDVVLLDIALPDENGLLLIGKFRTVCPTANVLMLSMHSEPEYAAESVARGASGLVAKSEVPEVFIDAIRSVACGAQLEVQHPLSPRERDVLGGVARGCSNEEIADDLGLQPKTVEGYCQRLMDRLDLHTRVGLAGYARRLGL